MNTYFAVFLYILFLLEEKPLIGYGLSLVASATAAFLAVSQQWLIFFSLFGILATLNFCLAVFAKKTFWFYPSVLQVFTDAKPEPPAQDGSLNIGHFLSPLILLSFVLMTIMNLVLPLSEIFSGWDLAFATSAILSLVVIPTIHYTHKKTPSQSYRKLWATVNWPVYITASVLVGGLFCLLCLLLYCLWHQDCLLSIESFYLLVGSSGSAATIVFGCGLLFVYLISQFNFPLPTAAIIIVITLLNLIVTGVPDWQFSIDPLIKLFGCTEKGDLIGGLYFLLTGAGALVNLWERGISGLVEV